MKKLAMLTGGGDVPGLNSAIKGLALGALEHHWQPFGFKNGWLGLLAIVPEDPESVARWLVTLDANTVRTIDRFGGTCLHTARVNPGNVKLADVPDSCKHLLNNSPDVLRKAGPQEVYDFTKHVIKNLQKLQIDVLIPIGGDDTLSYGDRLHQEGFPIIGIPKTMDNDVFGTDYCLGFATAVNRSVAYLHQLRTCTASHERFAVVEVMGRNSGATSLIPSYLASVDRTLIAEVPFDVARLAALLQQDKRNNPSHYAMLTISEGASMVDGSIIETGQEDAYGHRKLGGIGQITGDALKKITGVGIIYQNLGYLVRSGAPDPIDVMVTFNFANLAIELLLQKKFGFLVRLKDGIYSYAPMSIVREGIKRVEIDKLYDQDHYKVKIASVLGMPMYLR